MENNNGLIDKERIEEICIERLDTWRDVLVKNNSTPFALISIGHNSRCGEIHMCILEGMNIDVVIAFIQSALDSLEKEKGGGKQMPELPREIEIMRVMNLVQGFGWIKVKEEVLGTKVLLTIEKEMFQETEVTGPGPPS